MEVGGRRHLCLKTKLSRLGPIVCQKDRNQVTEKPPMGLGLVIERTVIDFKQYCREMDEAFGGMGSTRLRLSMDAILCDDYCSTEGLGRLKRRYFNLRGVFFRGGVSPVRRGASAKPRVRHGREGSCQHCRRFTTRELRVFPESQLTQPALSM